MKTILTFSVVALVFGLSTSSIASEDRTETETLSEIEKLPNEVLDQIFGKLTFKELSESRFINKNIFGVVCSNFKDRIRKQLCTDDLTKGVKGGHYVKKMAEVILRTLREDNIAELSGNQKLAYLKSLYYITKINKNNTKVKIFKNIYNSASLEIKHEVSQEYNDLKTKYPLDFLFPVKSKGDF